MLSLTRGPGLAPHLLAGFDNFPLFEAAVLSERDSLEALLVTLLEEEVETLSGVGLSPVERASLTTQVGASRRLLVHLLRSWTDWADLLTPVSSLVGRMVQQSDLPEDL